MKLFKKTTLKKYLPSQKKVMNFNRLLADKKVIIGLLVVVDVLFLSALNYCGNLIYHFSDILQAKKNGADPKKYLSLINCLWYQGNNGGAVIFFFLVFTAILDVVLYYRIIVSYSEKYFNVGQKGTQRWATVEEIRQQYKEIPESGTETYPGEPGTIVAHFDGKLYLDTNINNNLILGITRSGKDEMYVFPSIDVYSRAELQHSMVVIDPKLEDYKASKETLLKRGYQVYLLNLDDAIYSMGYNPLTLIIKMYKNNEKSKAYEMARSYAHSLFNSTQSTIEPIWANTATDIFTALIIAVITDELALDESLNEVRIQAYTGKVHTYEKMTDAEQKAADERLLKDVADGIDPIEDVGLEGISKDYAYKNITKHEQRISIFNIIILFSELVEKPSTLQSNNSAMSALDDYFNKRDQMDLAKLKFATIKSAGGRTKGSAYTNMLSYLGTFIDDSIAKMTAESSLNLEDIGFGEKPVAVFLGIPDYDRSPHFIAASFIRQAYYTLAKRATNSKTQACTRPVRFICNECGNIDPIDSLDTFLTVSNGRGIGFDLYFQSYAQITDKYKDKAQTIIDNCANEIYIKASDPETLERISKKLGSETFIDVQRTGEKTSLSKTFMETPSEKPLLRPEELGNLLMGECIVMRSLKRKDNKGNDIIPYPIFNSVETGTRFLYRYEYLTDTFPNPNEIELKKVNTESREHIDLRARMINILELQRGIDSVIGLKPELTNFKDCPNYKLVDEILRKNIGENYMKELDIQDNYTWSRVLMIIEESGWIKEPVKVAIRSAMSS